MRGITPVISIVMMLMITIAIAGSFYMYSSGMLSSHTAKSIEIIDSQANKVTIRNTGTDTIQTGDISILIGGEPCTILNEYTIASGGTGDIEFYPSNISQRGVSLIGPSNTINFQYNGNGASYILEEQYEHFSNGGICSNNLTVLQNDKIKFFAAYPRTFVPSTTYNCLSGVSSYNDAFGASPTRIWALGTQASTYSVNEAVIDETRFQASGVATFSFSDPSKLTFSQNGDMVKYDGNTAGNLIPTITYGISPGKNYVSVTFSVKNNGTSDITTRLIWYGDQDGAGTCHFQSGFQAACTTTRENQNEKWIAEWRSYNYVMGYIAPTNGEVDIYGGYEGVRIEETATTTIRAGQTHSMTFYILADAKGSSGNEWAPIEQSYNELFG